jgi:hypothetical protein
VYTTHIKLLEFDSNILISCENSPEEGRAGDDHARANHLGEDRETTTTGHHIHSFAMIETVLGELAHPVNDGIMGMFVEIKDLSLVLANSALSGDEKWRNLVES